MFSFFTFFIYLNMHEKYLELLGVSKLATKSEIRDAYLKISNQNSNEEFQQVIEDAYGYLTNSKCEEYINWVLEGEVLREDIHSTPEPENIYHEDKEMGAEKWIDLAKQQVGSIAQRLKLVYS